MNNLDKFFVESDTKVDYARRYLDYLKTVLDQVDTHEVAKFINVLLEARDRESAIYFIGNGGSAATCTHFANDLAIGTNSWWRPFRAISLCDNNAVITAIANDSGYEQIFRHQLAAVLKPKDVVVAISASGNSANLIKAINFAKRENAITVGITAFDGGILHNIVDEYIHIQTEKGEYGPAEDVHMVLDHLVTSYLRRLLECA